MGLLNLCISNFISWEVIFITVVYYVYSLLLWRILPAKEVHGTRLVHHGHALLYRFNDMYIQTSSRPLLNISVD